MNEDPEVEAAETAVDAELADVERAHRQWLQTLTPAQRSDVYCLRVDISNRDRMIDAIRRRWSDLEPQLRGRPIPTWLREGVTK